ncbi:GNAT family N-acetyltransferase [Rhodoferax saidenbachensis]|uniref:GNAT family N-acetyltransferase n=1 Tax=Rhodoferax saidenbachensis TaxID=1484693 RepID=A0A1P8KFD5_9BURK|nr:GNAT family N-acetyltransferase [Rhodoferax saidenbachensis]APW44743.1 GNAT family N-acetyltransferase [Rhodoferax saidenbachensis]
MAETDYVTRVFTSPLEVDAQAWDALLQQQGLTSPFMQHAYLAAMHASGSACPATGWAPHFITLESGGQMVAACALYLKDHSYGEYVFDWAWANAYQQHRVPYYPKAVVAVPFTPVPGARLLACNAQARAALVRAVVQWCEAQGLSSLHLLFAADDDVQACTDAGLMLRHTVQFHWTNVAPTLGTDVSSLPPEGAHFSLGRPSGKNAPGYTDFDAFLASLAQDKRKKIRQERRKVAEAGVTFRHAEGHAITPADWDFFYCCYERTYLEHGNAPYLNRDFFQRMADTMPQNWLLFIAERDGRPIASSLIAIGAHSTGATGLNDSKVAYGRYWGALERVDCLHFEACYYQPLQWCIANGYQRFEGGAQGEHKMARALLPVKTTSAHWLAHPAFADAVARFLEREGEGIGDYLEDLGQRSPLRKPS